MLQPIGFIYLCVQVSVAVKWSSVVLAAGGGGDGGDGRDDGGGGGDHSNSASSASLPTGDAQTSCPRDRAPSGRRAAFSRMQRLSGVMGGGPNAGVVTKRRCLPIHLGRLSCSAEAGMKDGSNAVKVNG